MASADKSYPILLTQYNSICDDQLYFLFTEKEWKKLTSQKRKEILQEVENRMAVKQGRPACQIVTKELAANIRGYFDGEYITINEKLLRGARSMFGAKLGEKAIYALDTVIHEGRHAYQRCAVVGRVTNLVGEDTLREWLVNTLCYADAENGMKSFAFYAFQPLERDAREYAASEIVDIYRRVRLLSGMRDANFENGMASIRKEKIMEYRFAKALVTQDDIRIMQESISDSFLNVVAMEETPTISCMGDLVSFDDCLENCGMDKTNIAEALDRQVADLNAIISENKKLDNYLDGLDVFDLFKVDKYRLRTSSDKLDGIAAKITERTSRPQLDTGLLSTCVDGQRSILSKGI